jgi:plasmid replication initiation protein
MQAECDMSAPRRRRSARDQLDPFRALPGDLAPRDAQDLMAYAFFSLAKSKRIPPIYFHAGTITGDVLIWAASQIVEARDAGLKTSRLMAATPYGILAFVSRGTDVLDQSCSQQAVATGMPRKDGYASQTRSRQRASESALPQPLPANFGGRRD